VLARMAMGGMDSNVWVLMAMRGQGWQCVVMVGNVKARIAMRGHVRDGMVTWWQARRSETVSGTVSSS